MISINHNTNHAVITWTSFGIAVSLLGVGIAFCILYTSQWWVGFIFLLLSLASWCVFGYYMYMRQREVHQPDAVNYKYDETHRTHQYFQYPVEPKHVGTEADTVPSMRLHSYQQ